MVSSFLFRLPPKEDAEDGSPEVERLDDEAAAVAVPIEVGGVPKGTTPPKIDSSDWLSSDSLPSASLLLVLSNITVVVLDAVDDVDDWMDDWS